MNVLGLSAHFHDATASLVIDGRIQAAAAEERFSRQKHDSNLPHHATAFCLEHAGIQAGDLDAIVFYEQPSVKFTRVLASTLGAFPRSRGSFVGAMKGWLTQKLFIRNEISRALDIHPRTVHFVPHHTSHASHAFLTSPFEEAAILCVDAVGEWVCTSISRGRRGQAVEQLETFEYPHSLGLLYAAFTGFLGLRPNSEECSTMALAAFGKPTRVAEMKELLRLHDDGTYELATGYFDFLATSGHPFTSRLTAAFGEPAEAGLLAEHFDAFTTPTAPAPERVQRYADIAASVQVVLEEALLGLARRARAKTGCENLCFAGGVALNCVANRRLQREAPFERLFIPHDPGDGGAANGAALGWASDQGQAISPGAGADTPYLGRAYDPGPVLDMIGRLDDEIWERTGPGSTATRVPAAVEVERFDGDDEGLYTRVADLLQDGCIVGWVSGRFENGPRALGNRSLLADPASLDTARRMSRRVKLRAPFRPYSFAVSTEDSERALSLTDADDPSTLRWMQMVADVHPDAREALRAGLHVDGTTRPQVCRAEDNPRFHALLQTFGQARGIGAILNTSLNERGSPMVASPTEALAMFARTDMDALALDGAIIRKRW